MKKRRRWHKNHEIRIPDYSPSRDHRERSGDQGKPEHAGLPGLAKSHQDRSEAGGAIDFQSKSSLRAHRDVPRKRAAPRQICRLPSGLEKSLRTASRRRKNAGGWSEFVRAGHYRPSLAVRRWQNRLDNDELQMANSQRRTPNHELIYGNQDISTDNPDPALPHHHRQ